jgi:carbon monoxide dehydrogenase subunit G
MSLKVESKIGKNACLDVDLFNFLSDFTKFTRLLPPEHMSKLQVTPEECTINAGAMGNFTLKYIERVSPKLIKIGTEGAKEALTIWIQLKSADAYDTRVKITMSLEIGMMAKMMIKSKIQQFTDSMVDGICQIPTYILKS